MKLIPSKGTTMTVPELAELAEGGTVILTRDGQPPVSVRNVTDSDWESTSLANNPQFTALVQESRRSYREKGGISMADLRQELGLEAEPPGVSPDS